MAAKLLRRYNENPIVLVQLPLYTQQNKKKIKIIIISYDLAKVRTWLIYTFPGQNSSPKMFVACIQMLLRTAVFTSN